MEQVERKMSYAEWEYTHQDDLKESYRLQEEEGVKYVYPVRKIICFGCGNVFYTRIHSKRYCYNATCGRLGNYKHQLRHRLERRKDLVCAGCGKVFTPKRSDAKYCSNACRQRAYRQSVTDKPSVKKGHLV